MKDTNIIAIYRNRHTGQFRIQPFGRLPNGSAQPFGEQQHLGANVGDQELLNCILANLKNQSPSLCGKYLSQDR
jgi:hypothetical protein